jgi:serine/threonine protein kinase
MAFDRYYDRQEFDNRMSFTELEEQYAFTLGIEIEKGEHIFGNNDKAFYKANWIDRDEPPVVLIEKKRNQNIEEILFNLTLDHPHIIKTYGFVDPNGYNVKPNSVLLLQEYAKDGDLGSQLSQKFFVPKQNVFLEIFIQIADAMVFLSESKVIHGDLACRNVLLFKSDPHVPSKNLFKLIDFGLTRNNTGSLDAHTEIPVRYVASEILRSNGRSGYSEKSDVYSFGTFMWEACSFGKMPYEEIDDDDEVSRQKLAGNRLTRPNKCDPNIWKLMNLCWNDQPNNRPNFKKIHKQLKIIQNVESSLPPS